MGNTVTSFRLQVKGKTAAANQPETWNLKPGT
jgi:hypothetical protein